jgi:hypothetical protein
MLEPVEENANGIDLVVNNKNINLIRAAYKDTIRHSKLSERTYKHYIKTLNEEFIGKRVKFTKNVAPKGGVITGFHKNTVGGLDVGFKPEGKQDSIYICIHWIEAIE